MDEMTSEGNELVAFQKAIGITFRDPALLQRALTHTSYVNENPACGWGDNERLEFLGDAMGDFVAADYLYGRFPDWQEGQLTDVRADLVCAETLGRLAAQVGLGRALLLGRGEEQGGGRTRPALLSDVFEAFVGALYLDQGLEAVRGFLMPLLEAQLERLLAEVALRDAKSRLQEWSQGTLHATPTYVTVHEAGPDHAKQFTVQVLIQGRVYGEGSGRSKQAAEQAAAAAALEAREVSPSTAECTEPTAE
jgi:ribonuclease-3